MRSELLEECKLAAGDAWLRYEDHPWFSALESGELSIDKFVKFQAEDAPFIPFLHQTIALALSKAPTGSDWSRAAARLLNEVFVANELKAKKEILETLGVTDVRFDRWALSPRREAYANHLMRVALEGTAPQVAASLLPCTFFTQIVGRRFESVDIKGPPAFKRWAQIYTDKQMYNMLWSHVELMELGATGDSAAREELVRIFVRSTQHQVAVFDDALEPGPSWPQVSHPDFQWKAA